MQWWATRPNPDFLVGDTIVLHSSVLGCEVTAHVENNFNSLCVAEQVLAVLEALFATSLDSVCPHAQEFTIEIVRSDAVKGEPVYEFRNSNTGQVLTIKHSRLDGDPGRPSSAQWLPRLALEVAARTTFIRNIEEYGERVLGQEMGFGRAINFSDAAIPLKNVLGQKPKWQLSDWKPEPTTEVFSLRRDVPWSEGINLEIRCEHVSTLYDAPSGEGDPPKELLDKDRKHSQRRVFSLINVPLWEKAGWCGMGFAFDLDLSAPPILGLTFSSPWCNAQTAGAVER